MKKSSDKKSSLLSNFKLPEKKGIGLSFKGSNRRIQTQTSEIQHQLKQKVQFSAKSKSKSLKKAGITTVTKQRKSMNSKLDYSIASTKKTVKKQINKQRKIFPCNFTKTVEPTKLGRLKTQPTQNTQLSQIYKKLGKVSGNKQKLCEKQSSLKNKVKQQDNYELGQIIGKGTFGVVYKAMHIPTKQVIAIKTVLQDKRYKNRQLQILRMLKHPNVLQIKQFYYTTNHGQQYLNVVMPYFEETIFSLNKKYLINNLSLDPILVKIYSYQLFRGLNYLNSLNIAHRDIKPHNILVDKKNKVVICDFGSAKQLIKGEDNIAYICSRCYRAPQLIFGKTQYTPQIDMWSIGCVIMEMINGQPPFIGDSQMDLLINIIKVLGTPSKQTILQMNPQQQKQYNLPFAKGKDWKKILKPKTDFQLIDLLSKIMKYSPLQRITSFQALCHPYFDEIRDEQNFKKISKITGYSDFFNFNKEELKTHKNFQQKLLPNWALKLKK